MRADPYEGERRLGDLALMARVMPFVWVAGTSTFLVIVLTGGADEDARTGFLVLDAIAWAICGVIVGGRRRPVWFWEFAQYAGISLISAIILLGDDPAAPFAFFYVWLAAQGAFFEGWQRLIPQGIYASGTYAST